jgi:hypothetical protein
MWTMSGLALRRVESWGARPRKGVAGRLFSARTEVVGEVEGLPGDVRHGVESVLVSVDDGQIALCDILPP